MKKVIQKIPNTLLGGSHKSRAELLNTYARVWRFRWKGLLSWSDKASAIFVEREGRTPEKIFLHKKVSCDNFPPLRAIVEETDTEICSRASTEFHSCVASLCVSCDAKCQSISRWFQSLNREFCGICVRHEKRFPVPEISILGSIRYAHLRGKSS